MKKKYLCIMLSVLMYLKSVLITDLSVLRCLFWDKCVLWIVNNTQTRIELKIVTIIGNTKSVVFFYKL